MPAQPSTIASAWSSSSAARSGGAACRARPNPDPRAPAPECRRRAPGHGRPCRSAGRDARSARASAPASSRREKRWARSRPSPAPPRRCRRPGCAAMRARRIEAGIVEAGDDGGSRARPFAVGDLREQAGHGQRLVVIALDRGRPHARGRRNDLGAGRRHAARRRGDRRVIEAVVLGLTTRMRIRLVRRAGRRRLTSTMAPSVPAMTRKENSVVTVPSA